MAIAWSEVFNKDLIGPAVRIFALIFLGFPFILALAALVAKSTRRKLSPQANMLIRKAIIYFGTIVIFIAVLHQSGYRLTALLGAAGIAGIAIGFASQTSISNIISGLFLISEKPFAVGDVIQVGNTKGTILTIDLLSVKLRTFDNHLIRLPNEMLIKSEVRNITRFPIRRLDINLGIAYKENVEKVRKVLLDIAEKNEYCLDEPEPSVRFVNFGESALEFLFAVWCVQADYLKLQTRIMQDIKERFDAEGIEIPFPHRTLYAGSVTEPLPIRVVDGRENVPVENESAKTQK
ncbi:MAG: mechanosensitive ion channel family protein [Sedimentisphaerales bacterium]|nr:mechanosensitive ion channel family protein [Sedimentisphaerales bacterium]